MERHIVGEWDRMDPRRIFVEGAAWWQFHSNGATMWSSERKDAEAEAERRFGDWMPLTVPPKPPTAETP